MFEVMHAIAIGFGRGIAICALFIGVISAALVVYAKIMEWVSGSKGGATCSKH
jgi:hypothetical protein